MESVTVDVFPYVFLIAILSKLPYLTLVVNYDVAIARLIYHSRSTNNNTSYFIIQRQSHIKLISVFAITLPLRKIRLLRKLLNYSVLLLILFIYLKVKTDCK